MELLALRRETALKNWRKATGLEELARWQSAYNEVQQTMDLIEKPLSHTA